MFNNVEANRFYNAADKEITDHIKNSRELLEKAITNDYEYMITVKDPDAPTGLMSIGNTTVQTSANTAIGLIIAIIGQNDPAEAEFVGTILEDIIRHHI